MNKEKLANGHTFHSIVDGEPRDNRVDLRLTSGHQNCRTNMRNRDGSRSQVKPGRALSGTHYADEIYCTTCRRRRPRDMFENMAVQEALRDKNGCNTRCRMCQVAQYDLGYRLDDIECQNFLEPTGSGDADSSVDESATEIGSESDADTDEIVRAAAAVTEVSLGSDDEADAELDAAATYPTAMRQKVRRLLQIAGIPLTGAAAHTADEDSVASALVTLASSSDESASLSHSSDSESSSASSTAASSPYMSSSEDESEAEPEEESASDTDSDGELVGAPIAKKARQLQGAELPDGYFEIEAILKHRRNTRNNNRMQFLVKWADYGAGFNSWEPATNLCRCNVYREYVKTHGIASSRYVSGRR